MSYYHHGTIRKYVAAILSQFNDTEIQYQKSTSETVSKSIPLTYTTKEKSRILDQYTSEQLLSGNYNVLPRASLALTSMSKAPERTTNKNIKINQYKTEDSIDYLYNSVSYIFSFELVFQCRGMNEVTQIVEQICPKFNPTVNIDVWDATNLDEPTRVPVSLDGVDIENEEYSELSSNLFNISMTLSLKGNLYPPIKSIERVKEFKLRLSEYDDQDVSRKSILGWDVDKDGFIENGDVLNISTPQEYPPVILSINESSSNIGDNDIIVEYEDQDNTINELKFEWLIISGNDASISYEKDRAVLTANAAESVEVQVTITDIYGNYASMSKIINIS